MKSRGSRGKGGTASAGRPVAVAVDLDRLDLGPLADAAAALLAALEEYDRVARAHQHRAFPCVVSDWKRCALAALLAEGRLADLGMGGDPSAWGATASGPRDAVLSLYQWLRRLRNARGGNALPGWGTVASGYWLAPHTAYGNPDKECPHVRNVLPPLQLYVARLSEAAGRRPVATGATATGLYPRTLVYCGHRQYRLGNGTPAVVLRSEDEVLQAVLGIAVDGVAAVDSATLEERSGYPDAWRLLLDLRTRYGGRFAAAIDPAGGKGQGGYVVRICRHPDAPTRP